MKVMLGKILIEGDKTYFVSKDNVQIPVVLEGKRKKWVEGKDHIAIYKEFEGKGKYYLDLVSTRNTIEELIYHIDFDNENQKAQLKTFSEPSFDPASINEHIEKSPYNKVMVGLYYCPDGKKFKLNNVSFIVHRKSEDAYLSAEEYRAKIAKEVGNKLLRLQNAGIKIDDFQVIYSNIRYMKYNNETFIRLQGEGGRLFNSARRQSEYGGYSKGYVTYSEGKDGRLWAENNPITTTGETGSNPFYLIGRFPNKEESQEYGFEQIEKALGTYKEQKQEQEEEETSMSLC